jgi:hypothetical protein
MSIEPVNPPPYPPPAQPAGQPARVPGTSFADALDGAQSPPVSPERPPAQALEAVQVASKVYASLRAVDRELRFEHTAHGVRIEVYDGDGKFIQSVPATDVLKLAGGEQTWLA